MIDQAAPTVGIILVNLNTYDDTAHCLRSLREATYSRKLIVVVDNGSSDGSGNRLRQDYPEVVHLRSEINLGFTGGNNLGIEYALEHGADHILLLNNDTIVTTGFLEPLVERLLSATDIAAVSGKIYYWPESYGGRQNIIWYAGVYQKWHTGYHHIGVMEEDQGQFERPLQVPYASGCLMLMRGDLIRTYGPLSDEYFIYWEEADWCHRLRSAGFRCMYEPRSVIYHNFRSAPLGRETPFYMYMQTRNAFLYAKRHYRGWTAWRFRIFYPVYLLYRFLYQIKAHNSRGAKAMLQGILDYVRGFRGIAGLRERGYIRS